MALKVRKNLAKRPPDIALSVRGAEACPLNSAMELLGGAWAPHVIYYLSEQPRRFGELRLDIPAISARVLSQRLKQLESKGVVNRRVVPTSPPSTEYQLTVLGKRLVPAILAIADVGRSLQSR
ncbi:MAG: winged helix-turn-helix transcriptional regulator [Polyangiaceae bacterium]